MKARIVDIARLDAYYDHRALFIGQTGDFTISRTNRGVGYVAGEFIFDTPIVDGSDRLESVFFYRVKLEGVTE